MIHKYELDGYKIVLDVNSGSLHEVDDCAFAILDFIEEKGEFCEEIPTELYNSVTKFTREEIEETYNELYRVYKEGLLFSEDLEPIQIDMTTSPIKAMCLHVVHDCNLRCKYCFADSGEYHTKREMMSFEVGKKAIDYLIASSKGRRNLEIDYFGGEPLMNFEVVKKITDYAKSLEKEHDKVFRFTVTTNGVLLDDAKLAYINEHMGNIVLSVDGRPEVNDKMRKKVDGSGCYDLIMPKFKHVANARDQQGYYVRGTFTKWNKDFDKDVRHFVENGFEQISVEPVASPDDVPYSISKEDLPEIYAAYENLARDYVRDRVAGKFWNFFHYMIDLSGGPCVIKRVTGCGAGNEYVAISPSGEIYPCHRFVGMEEFKMGELHDDLPLDMGIKKTFASQSIYTKPDCQDCFAKFFCSGGCAANSLMFGGDFSNSYEVGCLMTKKRVECALMAQVAIENHKN